MSRHWWVVFLALALAGGCDDTSEMDAGTGGSDAGAGDADGGGGGDAGSGEDAGMAPPDCAAPVTDDLWVPPEGLVAFSESERGRVLRCGAGEALDAATIDARARAPIELTADDPGTYDGPELTSGADVTHVLYRSERRDGSGGFSSGTLYLPAAGASDLPLLVHVAGTTGLADHCAPSRGRFKDLERALMVLVGNGNAVFVPDMIGLGTPGTLAYLESAEAAHSVLDGARAALAIAPDGALSGEILISGHSAGGHAALVSQSRQREYAPELNVIGVSAVAGVWFDTGVFGELLTVPGYTTAGEDGWNVVFGAMYFIGHSAAYDGEANAYEFIHPDRRDAVRTAFETTCLSEPGGTTMRDELNMIAGSAGQIFDEGIQIEFSNRFWCDAGMADRCPARVATWIERFAADRPPLDPMGAPVWFHQGGMDNRSTPELMQCPISQAETNGVTVATCYYPDSEHGPLSADSAPWIASWVAALGAGDPAPDCLDTTPFPFGDVSLCDE